MLLWRKARKKENDPDLRRGLEVRIAELSTEIPPSRRDSEALQILATEHWSLLATRALTYQESLGRVSMFLTILSGAVIALALVAQAAHFGPAFFAIAIFMLAVVFLTGIFTVARLQALNRDDFRWVLGMNRLRNAYLDLHPELEPYFTTSPHDDLSGALQTLGIDPVGANRLGSLFHGLQTLPGMLSMIVASVGGAIGGLVAAAFGAPPVVVLLSGFAAFLLAAIGMVVRLSRSVRRLTPSLAARFPSPPKKST
jgi:hypothetical protein